MCQSGCHSCHNAINTNYVIHIIYVKALWRISCHSDFNKMSSPKLAEKIVGNRGNREFRLRGIDVTNELVYLSMKLPQL